MEYTCTSCGRVSKDSAFSDPKRFPFFPCDTYLRFTCRECGDEALERLHVTWVDVVHMILFEMIKHKECDNVVEGLKFFHWRSICDEIEQYWRLLWDRDQNSNWQTSVVAALSTYASSRFRSGKELRGALNGFWTLLDVVAPSEVEPSISRRADYRFSAEGTLIPLEPDRKGRRRHDGHGEGEAAREQEREARRLRKQMRKLAASYVFSNLDFDRPNPSGPLGISQLPTHTASQIKVLSADGWTVGNEKGYCMARTTHGIDRGGKWYFEVRFTPASSSEHIRVGWAQILAQTQGPVGFDEFSYGIRDRDGHLVHCGRPYPYAQAFPPDTVVGILLELPTEEPPSFAENERTRIEKQFPPLKFGQYHVRQDILQQGSISFFLDGRGFGTAFANIYHGKYYPAVSMFGGAKVTVNPGPLFAHPPPDPSVQPVCRIASP